MRTPGAAYNDRALDARLRREWEMTYPENEVRPFVHRDALAYPFNNPSFTVKAGRFPCKKFSAHLSNLTESGIIGQTGAIIMRFLLLQILFLFYLLIALIAFLSSDVLKTQVEDFPVAAVPYI